MPGYVPAGKIAASMHTRQKGHLLRTGPYAPMQHTRAPGSAGSHGGHLSKPVYPRTCNAAGAAMRGINWQTLACNCSDAPNGCGRWRARAALLHTPAGIVAAAVTRLRTCWTPRSQPAAASP
jgi:hypothetical protein